MDPDVFQSKLRKPDSLNSLNSLNACLALKNVWVPYQLVVLVLTVCLFGNCILEVDARSSKRAQSSRSSSRHRTGRASASSRTAGRRGGRSSKSSRSGTKRNSRSRRSKAVRASSQHGPTAAQIKRQETSGANDLEKRTDLERSYRAYDQGLSEWLSGNYSQAAKSLNEAYELYSDFHGSHDVLDSLYLYDLGQAAEAAGDTSLAKNSYQRSLRRRPDFSDCCIRLTALLTKNGETALALVYARRLADKNPQDPRAQFLLATMLERAGFAEEGKTARENFNLLMKGGSVNKPQTQMEPANSLEPSVPEQSPDKNADRKPDQNKEDGDTESGVLKKDNSSDKESGAGGEPKKPEP